MAGNYANRTDRYDIPTIGRGEYISESDEARAAQIIETQLSGAIAAHSGGHGVFRVGFFSTSGDDNGFIVKLSPNGGTPAAEGFIRLIYFKVTQDIEWPIVGDGVHKLFLQLVEDETASSRQFGDVVVGSTLAADIPDDALLIAEATVSGSSITVDDQPADRLNIDKLADHIAQSVNPHTSLLTQDQMVISGLTVQNAVIQTLEVLGSLKLSGLAIFQDQVQMQQDLIVGGNLVVSGVAFFTDGVFLNGTSFAEQMVVANLDVTSGVDFRNRTTFHDDLIIDSGITIDGRDLGIDGLVLDEHTSGITAFQNPHRVTADQVSGIPTEGGLLRGNLDFLSGVAVDGIDPTTLIPLIDGSNADSLHTHNLSGIPEKCIFYAPEYCNTILSGAGTVLVEANYDITENQNFYKTSPRAAGPQKFALVVRTGVPADFREWSVSGITFGNATTQPPDPNCHVSILFKDTTGADVPVPNSQFLRNPFMTDTVLNGAALNAGSWGPGGFFTTIIEMSSLSGITDCEAFVGDLKLAYKTVYGSN